MPYVLLVTDYLAWHYTQAWRDLLRLWTNILWALFHFFAFGELIIHLFSPFKRVMEEKSKEFNLQLAAENMLVNGISRIVGALIRLTLMGSGLIIVILALAGTLASLVIWIVLPVLILYLFFQGLIQLSLV
jgi:hypothetical protein